MTTAKLSLSSFCEKSNISPQLIRAVVKEDGGFHGFIYNADTEPFASRHRHLISDMAEKQVHELGADNIFEMIQGFGCFRHGEKPSVSDIGSALFTGKDRADGVPVLNALAWYAGEEVCRSYCDLSGEND